MSNLLSPVESFGNRKEILTGVVTLGAAGAISSQSCQGFTVTKTATKTGRYTVTLGRGYKAISFAGCTPEISADTAAVTAKALVAVLRGVSASGKVAYFQGTIVPTAVAPGADAEFEDSTKLRFVLVADRGSL